MTVYRCEQCGGPMERLTSGGQEPDGHGGWQPSTSHLFRCKTAWEAHETRRAELRRQLAAELAEHGAMVRLPWPVKAPLDLDPATA